MFRMKKKEKGHTSTASDLLLTRNYDQCCVLYPINRWHSHIPCQHFTHQYQTLCHTGIRNRFSVCSWFQVHDSCYVIVLGH